MTFKKQFYFTSTKGEQFFCQLTKHAIDGQEIFSFRSEHSGDVLSIKKVDGEWVYHGGRQYFLESWILELGNQVDSEEYV